jgi:predicted methyltransferase
MKNFLLLDEILEFLKNRNLRNIILTLPADEKEMMGFIDVKEKICEVLMSAEFKISVAGLPFCFLGENKDHATTVIGNYTKVNKCKLCDMEEQCKGVDKNYLEKFGQEEISPFNRVNKSIRKIRKKMNSDSLIYTSDDDIYYLLMELRDKERFMEATDSLGYPIAIAIQMVDEMEKEGMITIDQDKVIVNVKLRQNKNKTKDYSSLRIDSDPAASQLTIRQEDLEKRVEYIIKKCPSGGVIAFLGDDDFISLSMASKNHFEKIVVLEFDKRIVDKIKEIVKKEKYAIDVVHHDLRKRLPEEMIGTCDVFYTDSPYSMNGFGLFVSRGVELLKKEPKKHGFASFSCEMPEIEMVELPAQNVINKMKLIIERKEMSARNTLPVSIEKSKIEEIRKKLKEYTALSKQESWYLGALARKEHLFHFLTTNQTLPLIKGDFNEELYYTEYALNFYIDEGLKKELKKNHVFNWKNGI